MPSPARRSIFWAASFALLLGVRLCHTNVLWVDEAYGLAAARRILEGTALYRGLWFDKPPLYAWIYLPAAAAAAAWPLRVLGALFALLCCWLASRTARELFGEREGYLAAGAMAFFLSFDYPSALISLAPDLLLIPFSLATVWALASRRPALAAVCAGAGLLANSKALLLLPLVLVWNLRAWRRVLPVYGATAAAVCLLARGWWEPVWRWGALYSSDSPLAHPLTDGIVRTAGWAGFHAALVLSAVFYFARKNPHRFGLAVWLALAFAMVVAGERFFPRYYFALLPVMTVAAGRGAARLPRPWAVLAVVVALAIPAARFGVRHIATLRGEPAAMRDLSLYADCREAGARLHALAKPGDTLFVWGYRPELNVLAGLPGATPFLDSQPLTGVLAERHLTRADITAPEIARNNRRKLMATHPVFIADGLGSYNPALAITRFEDLGTWLAGYRLVAETAGFRIYQRL